MRIRQTLGQEKTPLPCWSKGDWENILGQLIKKTGKTEETA